MLLDIFKRTSKRSSYPENAKYKLRDFVRFRHRGELHFGFIHEARVENGEVLYTIQMGGECPTFVYNYKEENIVGRVN
ncbi:MAG: hypothetical protein IJP20_01495 [Clostridia bacterium]|nr:hypothetical protein [Clostridia bacterium]